MDKHIAKDYLLDYFNETREVYTVLRHTSRSGGMRVIDCFIILEDTPYCISHLVSKVLDLKLHKQHYGVVINGCGMDMGFHLIYSLSSVLFNGYNREALPKALKDFYDKDAGYILRQEWF